METNPYAPPVAVVDDPPKTGLKRRSVILMIVLTLVTLGFYYPIWFLRRRDALNAMDSPRKLRLWPFVVYLVWYVFQFILGFANGVARGQLISPQVDLLLKLVQLAIAILLLVQCFFIKDILEDHLAGPGDQIQSPLLVASVKLSGLMTFLFQVFYLQYAINRYIVGAKSTTI